MSGQPLLNSMLQMKPANESAATVPIMVPAYVDAMRRLLSRGGAQRPHSPCMAGNITP